jgi:hypothetical protein
MRNLFKVSFENGETYYGVSKVKTAESFIKTNIGFAKFHLENPQIHTIVYFEELLLSTKFNCEMVASGTDEEMAVLKDTMVFEDRACMNMRKHLANKKKAEKEVIRISKEYIKILKGSKGDLTFIDKTFGLRRGLSDKMKFNTTHPIKPSFCLITSNVEII